METKFPYDKERRLRDPTGDFPEDSFPPDDTHKACRQILGKYAVSVTMETASEKFFVVRFSCDYSQNLDKNGQIIYTGENQECHKDIMDLTEKITDSIVYRTVSLEKENRYILNCAIERSHHEADS